eukprot:CAMPEP_0175662530 /NCGR_PEP_ID=MMETSP0097-20121207/15523_1 /TAXON_ID=311494 /ORGANISM="Alexandrium monilatum, Strain CCMP3105" /LENGTH=230 /DNA_ID=CAMNT_0016968739 /DNA_START=80 /DNA_END=768 /DNA_ORIENTATION=+
MTTCTPARKIFRWRSASQPDASTLHSWTHMCAHEAPACAQGVHASHPWPSLNGPLAGLACPGAPTGGVRGAGDGAESSASRVGTRDRRDTGEVRAARGDWTGSGDASSASDTRGVAGAGAPRAPPRTQGVRGAGGGGMLPEAPPALLSGLLPNAMSRGARWSLRLFSTMELSICARSGGGFAGASFPFVSSKRPSGPAGAAEPAICLAGLCEPTAEEGNSSRSSIASRSS